jgi:hypothetical protein
MMTDQERTELLDYLHKTSAALIDTIAAFPADRFNESPAEGRWSAAQTLEHIVFVEGRALGRVKAALAEPPSPDRRSAMEGRDAELISGVTSRINRVEAPAILHPVGGKSREELIEAFQAARAVTTQFASEIQANLRCHFAPHPVFGGDLDCFQWLMIIPSHGERHRLQIEEIRASF